MGVLYMQALQILLSFTAPLGFFVFVCIISTLILAFLMFSALRRYVFIKLGIHDFGIQITLTLVVSGFISISLFVLYFYVEH